MEKIFIEIPERKALNFVSQFLCRMIALKICTNDATLMHHSTKYFQSE